MVIGAVFVCRNYRLIGFRSIFWQELHSDWLQEHVFGTNCSLIGYRSIFGRNCGLIGYRSISEQAVNTGGYSGLFRQQQVMVFWMESIT